MPDDKVVAPKVTRPYNKGQPESEHPVVSFRIPRAEFETLCALAKQRTITTQRLMTDLVHLFLGDATLLNHQAVYSELKEEVVRAYDFICACDAKLAMGPEMWQKRILPRWQQAAAKGHVPQLRCDSCLARRKAQR